MPDKDVQTKVVNSRELGFNIRLVEGPRMISCIGNRAPALEIFATKKI